MKIHEIKYLVGKKGLKFIDIDRKFGLRQGGTRFACGKPYKAGEEALANILEISLKELFPERYDKNGCRLSPQPKDNYIYKTMKDEYLEALVEKNA